MPKRKTQDTSSPIVNDIEDEAMAVELCARWDAIVHFTRDESGNRIVRISKGGRQQATAHTLLEAVRETWLMDGKTVPLEKGESIKVARKQISNPLRGPV